EIHLLVEQGIDRERRWLRGEQRISVGIRRENGLGPDIARGTCAVFDDDGLTKFLVEAFSNDTRHSVDAATGWHTDDDLERLAWEICRGILRERSRTPENHCRNRSQQGARSSSP